MDDLHHPEPDVSPAVQAGLMLAALSLLRRHCLPRPTVEQVLNATAAGRSRAYEARNELLRLLPTLSRPVGRPKTQEAPPADLQPTEALSRQALGFLADHPGAISGGPDRRRYGVAYHRFVLECAEKHPELPLPSLAGALATPLGTLKDWLRGGALQLEPAATDQPTAADQVTEARLATLAEEYRSWRGDFSAFCRHVQYDLRIPYGRTLIASLLEGLGLRTPRRRPGRSPDEKALRGAFETFFAGAQWEADGSPINVIVNGRRFTYNLEITDDSHTDAAVGVSVRDEEDSQALTDAFDHGVVTTGSTPLALVVDGKPSNHTDQVHQHIGETIHIQATKGRPQNKPHVEGTFGLFSQTVPPLEVDAETPREMGRQILDLVALTAFCVLNHKPRRDKAGRSRVDLYTDSSPTPEQVEQARAALEGRRRKQEQAQATLNARQDPVVRQALDDAFDRLLLSDPTGNIRSAIARYPLDAVLAGIATFEAKRRTGSLSDGVDGRYLFGIVRNIAQQDEGLRISELLLRERLAARDRLLVDLEDRRDTLLQMVSEPRELLHILLDRALDTDRRLDRLFWLRAAADHLSTQHDSQLRDLLRTAAQHIHAAFDVHYTERLAAYRFLANTVIPLN
jgi:hypothetical protein